MPPQAKGEKAKLSTRYWAAPRRDEPAGPPRVCHDGGERRRPQRGARGREGALRGGAYGAAGRRNGKGLTC